MLRSAPSGHRARLIARGSGWTYAAGMATDRTPGQSAPMSRAESLSAHAEGSISEDAVLLAARERAVDIGAGAVTPAVGALLSLLVKLSGGKAVVEVGTGAGVSSLWLLSGMSDDGVLTTIDIEPEHHRIAKEAFSEGGIGPSRTRLISSLRYAPSRSRPGSKEALRSHTRHALVLGRS